MPDMPDHTQENLPDQILLPWISYYMQKANFLALIIFEISKFKELSNPIGLEYFQLQLKNYVFHSHVAFVDSQRWCII